MTNEQSNLNSDVAQDVRQRSEYLNQVTSFAQFMYKEHIEPSDGERTLLLCAADGGVGDGKQAHMHVILGSQQTNAIALTKMMCEDEMAPLFRRAWAMARMRDEMIDELPTMRRRLRTLYGIAVGIALWSAVLIVMAVAGIGSWITTVSNLMLMGFLTLLTVREIRDKRRRIESVRDEERRNRDDRLSLMGEAFMSALKKHMENCGTDREDDE